MLVWATLSVVACSWSRARWSTAGKSPAPG
uniref:Uncharacterized protein n=1 Tax=Arundo donax TaxID=35708 RepID=A0A0A9AJ34_ARUDO